MKKILTSIAILSSILLVNAQQNLSQGGTGWSTSTTGDLLTGTSSTLRYTRLPIGSTGQVLWVNSGKPAWTSTSTLGFLSSLICSYPIICSGSNISSGLSTSTVNNWIAANTFNATTSVTELRALGSAGIDFHNNTGGQIALFGAGGGTGTSLFGGLNVTGQTTLSTASATGITSTNLYSTNYYPGFSNSFVAVDINGKLIATTSPTFSSFFATTTIQGVSTTTFTFATSTTGIDFTISTSTGTITFNLPVASGSNTGKLSSTDWTTFNNKLGSLFSVASGTGLTVGNLFATNTMLVSANTSFSSTTSFAVSSTSVATVGTLYATGTVQLATTTANGDITMRARIVKRVVGYASNASTTIDFGTTDVATTTITATTTFVNPNGTSTAIDTQPIMIRYMATSTAFKLFWGTQFSSSTLQDLPTQTASGTTDIIFSWDNFRKRLYLQSYNIYP